MAIYWLIDELLWWFGLLGDGLARGSPGWSLIQTWIQWKMMNNWWHTTWISINTIHLVAMNQATLDPSFSSRFRNSINSRWTEPFVYKSTVPRLIFPFAEIQTEKKKNPSRSRQEIDTNLPAAAGGGSASFSDVISDVTCPQDVAPAPAATALASPWLNPSRIGGSDRLSQHRAIHVSHTKMTRPRSIMAVNPIFSWPFPIFSIVRWFLTTIFAIL